MFLSLLIAQVALGAPAWISQDTFRKSGSELLIVCNGRGPDISKARSEAMNSCVQSAGEQLPTTWKLTSKSKETDVDVSMSKEALADQRVEGLMCEVKSEFVDYRSDFTMVFVKCRFDLSQAKTTALNIEKITSANAISIDAQPGCDHIHVIGGPYGRNFKCEEGKPTVITLIPGEHYVSIYKRGYYGKNMEIPEGVSYQEFIIHLKKRAALAAQ